MRHHVFSRRSGLSLATAVAISGFLAVPAQAAGPRGTSPHGTTELVNPVDGEAGVGAPDASTTAPAVTPDGRYVAFQSRAVNIPVAPGTDSNNAQDIFVRDTETGTARRISNNPAGDAANRDSISPAISDDGRYVAFASNASDLVPVDGTNIAAYDIFVSDLDTGGITKISTGLDDTPDSGGGSASSISADGGVVAFRSASPDLVPGDTNGLTDVFVWQRSTGRISRVSVTSSGAQATSVAGAKRQDSVSPKVSGDGKTVVFVSGATNLVPGDTNGLTDLFAHSLVTGDTTRVSVGPNGEQATGGVAAQGIGATDVTVSADGTVIGWDGNSLHGLVDDDLPYRSTGFVTDLTTGAVRVAGETVTGGPTTDTVSHATVSPDGAFVTFQAYESDLVADDTNRTYDVFVQSLESGRTVRVSVASDGTEGDGISGSEGLALLPGGSSVLFTSRATNLVADPISYVDNLYVHRFSPGFWTD
ncbi:PD40 domain-containing protein [Kineosporia sp. J2-2]|uniref:PD40 domain-containing protein n=1 Tax=Kineosporia corallincola TaxID=2835133 RepID=A0ABS5TN89_9ACTN|nr:PD40 domain-containing protein [Kineosporia corallincola]MBT0772564.1 PD40 domain-containing protein [Kineosporia corallincola]